MYTARGGIRDPDHVDQAYLLDQYDVPDGARYADLAVLRGDPSDGLPGVVGIGAKSAASLLRTFGDLDGVIQAIDDVDIRLKGARLARLSKARDYLAVAPTVVDVVRDCPVPDPDGDPPHGSLPRTVADARLISQLAVQYQLTRQFTRLLDALHIT
nr:5'-3' exonuclease H3TH domain-containing protein [Austwickia sp. TVS 96-490-7B]